MGGTVDTTELIRLSQQGDKAARDRLVTDNVGLVWSIVRRFLGRGHEADDLFQIGSIGLIKAIDKFDLKYDVRFSTYAVPMIAGEIKRFLRDDGIIKVSRSLKETASRIRLYREELEGRLGREPTIEEICEGLNIEKEEAVMALEAGAEVESLYKTIFQSDGNAIYLMDKVEQDKDSNEELLTHMALQEVVAGLDDRDRELIILRYFREKTQTEIARDMGISQVQVSRLEKKILKKMREHFIN